MSTKEHRELMASALETKEFLKLVLENPKRNESPECSSAAIQTELFEVFEKLNNHPCLTQKIANTDELERMGLAGSDTSFFSFEFKD